MAYSEIHIWGDSLARGIYFNEQKQRYAISSLRYTALLEERFGLPVHNHSIMGITAADGYANFLKNTSKPEALCVIEYGGNDCDLDWAHLAAHPTEPPQAKAPLSEYRQTLASFVRAVRERGMEPLLVTPVSLHAERYFRWVTRNLDASAVLKGLSGDVNSIYRWQERYTLAMRDVATHESCPLLDMRDAFLAQSNYEDLMCVDGIHPSEAGYRLIADVALKAALASPRMPRHSTEAVQHAPAKVG